MEKTQDIVYLNSQLRKPTDEANLRKQWLGVFEGGVEFIHNNDGLIVRGSGKLIVNENNGLRPINLYPQP